MIIISKIREKSHIAEEFVFRGKIIKSDLEIEANEDIYIIVEGKFLKSGRVRAADFKIEFRVNNSSINPNL